MEWATPKLTHANVDTQVPQACVRGHWRTLSWPGNWISARQAVIHHGSAPSTWQEPDTRIFHQMDKHSLIQCSVEEYTRVLTFWEAPLSSPLSHKALFPVGSSSTSSLVLGGRRTWAARGRMWTTCQIDYISQSSQHSVLHTMSDSKPCEAFLAYNHKSKWVPFMFLILEIGSNVSLDQLHCCCSNTLTAPHLNGCIFPREDAIIQGNLHSVHFTHDEFTQHDIDWSTPS